MTLVTNKVVSTLRNDKNLKQVGLHITPQAFTTPSDCIDFDTESLESHTESYHSSEEARTEAYHSTSYMAGLETPSDCIDFDTESLESHTESYHSSEEDRTEAYHSTSYMAGLEQLSSNDSLDGSVEHDQIVTVNASIPDAEPKAIKSAFVEDPDSDAEYESGASIASCSTEIDSSSDTEVADHTNNEFIAKECSSDQTSSETDKEYSSEDISSEMEHSSPEVAVRSLSDACSNIPVNALAPKLSATNTPKLGSIVLVKPRASNGLKAGRASRFNVVVVDERPKKTSLKGRALSGITKRKTTAVKAIPATGASAYNVGSESSGWDTQNEETEACVDGDDLNINPTLEPGNLQGSRALSDASLTSLGSVRQEGAGSKNAPASLVSGQRSSWCVTDRAYRTSSEFEGKVLDLDALPNMSNQENLKAVQMSASMYSLDINSSAVGPTSMERIKSGRFTLTSLGSNSCESLSLAREKQWAQSTPDLYEKSSDVTEQAYNNTSAPNIADEASPTHFSSSPKPTRPHANNRFTACAASANVSPVRTSKTNNKSLGRFIVRTRSDSVPRIRTPVPPMHNSQMPSPRSNSEQYPPGRMSLLGSAHGAHYRRKHSVFAEPDGHNVGVISGTNYSTRRSFSASEQATVVRKIPSADSGVTLTHASHSIKDPTSANAITSIYPEQIAPGMNLNASAANVYGHNSGTHNGADTSLTPVSLAMLPSKSPLGIRHRPSAPMITQQVVHTETYAQGPVRIRAMKAHQAEANYLAQSHVQGEDTSISSQTQSANRVNGTGGSRKYSQPSVYQQSGSPQYGAPDMPIARSQSESFAEQLSMQLGQQPTGQQLLTRTHTITQGHVAANPERVEMMNAATAQTNSMLQDMMGMMTNMKTLMVEQEVKAEMRVRKIKEELTQQMHQQHVEACARIQALEEACRARESAVQLLMREKKRNFEASEDACQDSMLDTIAMQGYDIDCLRAENSRLRASAKCV
ncbi:hypothetical protein SARC_03393 [Sphaeroforma arctica JP610]|uniref:Uncharacterized protein n=1 Tax=Sphaeroforma arctica JP610 TaxID=667725 RepID=A0A0L0G685_9EUKA|nr:hypothetical protein SARC_03393 [Sphaeroforma arctica JP610]KNC84376.1 hypothetical protein SARC_03393 [Sphaeroforma arctica JP610]|eukprot:XP_014158278.1 hypothetical protein SARC_03393 [Sphaeroforma arctica JP610]